MTGSRLTRALSPLGSVYPGFLLRWFRRRPGYFADKSDRSGTIHPWYGAGRKVDAERLLFLVLP